MLLLTSPALKALTSTHCAVDHCIVASDETGSYGRRQLRVFGTLPCRTVREALKHQLARPDLVIVPHGVRAALSRIGGQMWMSPPLAMVRLKGGEIESE